MTRNVPVFETPQGREALRLEIEHAVDLLITRAQDLGFVVRIEPKLTPQGKRVWDYDVRHARGYYPQD